MSDKPSYEELERKIETLNVKLHKSKSNVREIQALAKIGSWEWDLEQQSLLWSDEIYHIFGLEPVSFKPSPEAFEAAIHPDDLEDFLKQRDRMLNEKREVCIVHRIILPDGSIRYVQERTQQIVNRQGVACRIIGTVQDITDRMQAKITLKENEEKYHVLFENCLEALFLTAQDGSIFLTNKAACELLGMSESEIISCGRDGVVNLKDPRLPAALEERRKNGKFKGELTFKKKDGTIFPVEVSSSVFENRYGNEKTCIFFHDITDRKRAEEALIESETLFRGMFNNHSSGMLLIDPKTGQIVKANQAAVQYYGYPLEDLIQMKIQQLNVLSSAEIIEKMSGALNRQVNSFEFKHLLAGGQVRDVLVHSTPITIQNQTLLFSIINDITASKQAEDALRKNEQRLASILYGTNVGTWEWNVQTGETNFNERWANIIGYTLHELDPISIQTWIDFAHPDDHKVSSKLLEKHFNREIDYYELECRMKHKNGSWVWVLDRGRVISWTDDDKPLMIAGTHQDITVRKRAEEARDKLQAQLTQFEKAESLSRMAGAIAHHFNNQLAVVIGNLELALEGVPQDAALFEDLTSAMQGAHKAAEVGGHMLTYLGQTTGTYIPIDLSEICRQSVSSLQASAPEEIALNVDLLTPGPVVRGNANQIQQVLGNLITNACEAMKKQEGEIDVIVKTVPRADIPPMLYFPPDWKPENETYACLEIRDTGCGIEEKYLDKVFDPFFSNKFTGRGLGLAIVLGIVKAHGGTVAVDSEKGEGSSFKVYLPIAAESVAQKPDEMIRASDLKTGGTVLLVEDEEMIRNMTTSMLTRMGFKVLEAIDGVDAVEIFQKHQDEIDVVVSDLTMPRMDGWETLAALRRIRPELPVIMTSGYDESLVFAGDHLESPQAFLHKPYKKSELKESLAKAMSGSNVE